MAIHHETGGDIDGFAIWDAWSALGGKYPGEGMAYSEYIQSPTDCVVAPKLTSDDAFTAMLKLP